MNIHNIWALGLFASLSIGCFSSCDKDDDDNVNKLNYSDPRVRTMTIPGVSKTFIVNDVESIIYNYDSLSYGTDLKALHPTFSGYQVKNPILYDSAGIWKSYPNDTSFKLDLSQGLKIRALSIDSLYHKDYTINIRVHLYDVESFEWEKICTQKAIAADNNNEKSVYANGLYHLFISKGEKTQYLTSKTGEKWTSKGEKSYPAQPNWTSLTEFNGKFFVEMGDSIYESNGDNDFNISPLQLPDGFSKAKPLFALGSRIWFIAEKADQSLNLCYAQKGDSTLSIGEKITDNISFDKLTATVSASGNSDLGYIFSQGSDGNCIILSVDKAGAIINPSRGTTFPYCEGMAIFSYENLLCAMGGKTSDGQYSNTTYSSTDSGLTWAKNSHRILPNNGKFCNAQVYTNSADNTITLIGGNQGEDATYAWKGILKQFIIDDILFGRN